jgi:adenine-specific DNA-methyltransferase
MVQAMEPNLHDYWLEPCMGPGAFIAPLRKKGIPKERIVGIDIDPLSGAEDKAATTVRGGDCFRWCASTEQRFTKIVANPPYVAIRKLHPRLQRPCFHLAVELMVLSRSDRTTGVHFLQPVSAS